MSSELAFELKTVVFHKQNLMQKILEIEVLINGKRTSVNLHKFRLTARKEVNFDYITNRKRDLMHASFTKITNARGRSVQRIGT